MKSYNHVEHWIIKYWIRQIDVLLLRDEIESRSTVGKCQSYTSYFHLLYSREWKVSKSVVYSAVFIGIHEKYLLISFSWLELDEFVSMRECEPVTIDGHSWAYILRVGEMFHAAGWFMSIFSLTVKGHTSTVVFGARRSRAAKS